MTDAQQKYLHASQTYEDRRDAYNQARAMVRTWPSQHPFKDIPDEVIEGIHANAVEMGHARDARDAAWRAYKKELKS